MKRMVRVTITKEYTITEESMREGVYSDEVQRLIEEGAVEEAYAKAMAVDVANLDEGQFGLGEILEWEGDIRTKFELLTAVE